MFVLIVTEHAEAHREDRLSGRLRLRLVVLLHVAGRARPVGSQGLGPEDDRGARFEISGRCADGTGVLPFKRALLFRTPAPNAAEFEVAVGATLICEVRLPEGFSPDSVHCWLLPSADAANSSVTEKWRPAGEHLHGRAKLSRDGGVETQKVEFDEEGRLVVGPVPASEVPFVVRCAAVKSDARPGREFLRAWVGESGPLHLRAGVHHVVVETSSELHPRPSASSEGARSGSSTKMAGHYPKTSRVSCPSSGLNRRTDAQPAPPRRPLASTRP